MKNAIYWIALQQALGYSTDKFIKIVELFEDARTFCNASSQDWRSSGLFTPSLLSKLKKLDIKKAQLTVDYCKDKNYSILTLDDEKYPECLKRIANPPAVLYINGQLVDFDNSFSVGMVGTRKCTLQSETIAFTLSFRLAQAGAFVVSGGALGIDSKCSQGALRAEKPSFIVLGCGLDYPYLVSNRDIKEKVSRNGAVISEYPPTYPPSSFTFPARNRIISALSSAITVIEAPTKSGALITVSHALEQGKDIFVVPGDISSPNFAGSNKLLALGAKPVYSAADILNEFSEHFPNQININNASDLIFEDEVFVKIQEKISLTNLKVAEEKLKYNKSAVVIKRPLDFEADSNTQKVYKAFEGESLSVEQICLTTGLSFAKVSAALLELEINDFVVSVNGSRYELK